MSREDDAVTHPIRPPRLALWVIQTYLRDSEEGEFLIGDLLEEYRQDICPSRGRCAAHFWFWGQVWRGMLGGPRASSRPDPQNRVEAPGGIKMTGWASELKYAFRSVIRQRLVTLLAVVTLALGIGSVTTVFNVIQTVLLAPLPYPESDRLVLLTEHHEGDDQMADAPFTFANFRDLGERTSTLAEVAAFRGWLFNLTGEETPERLNGVLVTRRFFDVIGVGPQLGRLFAPEEYQAGGDVAIIGYDLWVNRYGADPAVLDRSVVINNVQTRIVGVMPAGFDYPSGTSLWSPLSDGSSLWSNRTAHLLWVQGRMRPGATLEQVQKEMEAVAGRIAEGSSESSRPMTLVVRGMLESQTADYRSPLIMLFAAVLAVLLIGCLNVANLLAAQASASRQQLSIRVALGASRSHLIRQSFWESACIAMTAGLAGWLLAWWTTSLVRAYAPANIPRIDQLTVDWRLVLFAFVISVVTVFLFGLLPATRTASPSLTSSLRTSQRSMTGQRGNRTRDMLVVVEVAVAMVLLVGAGLLLHSFVRVMQQDPGFEPDRLLSFQLFLSPTRYSEGDAASRQALVLRRILDEIEGLPGVKSASLVNVAPLQGGPSTGFEIEGLPHPPGTAPLAEIRSITPGYFEALGIPLLAGRDFSDLDRGDSEPVMIVSRSLMEAYLQSEAVDRRITMTGWGDPRKGRVVGVVGDIKVSSLEDPERPTIYWPYPQFPQVFNTIVVRTREDPMGLLPAIRERVWGVDPDQPLAGVGTFSDRLRDSTAERRFLMSLVGFFSALALLLAMIGLYGVISYNIVHRIPEIGLRMALGATRQKVLIMVFSRGLLLTLAGVSIGTLGAVAASRQLASLLFGTHPLDPLTYFGVTLLMLGVSLVASLVPALRAFRVDPLTALRSQGN